MPAGTGLTFPPIRSSDPRYVPAVPDRVHVHVPVIAATVELFLSRIAGSLFLVADAVHLMAHLGIFVVLLLPFHYERHELREDIVTCVILALVILIAAWIAWDSVVDLLASRKLPRPAAMLVALLGLGANLTSAWLFRDPAQKRWSFRAALAHELSDAALTIAGLIGAATIALFHFTWVDPALSLTSAVWLGIWATRLIVRRTRLGRAAWASS